MRSTARIGAVMGLIIFTAGCLAGVALGSSIFSFYPDDREVLVPAYFTHDLQNGLTGTIKLKVDYDKGHVASVLTLSTDLKSETDFVDRFPDLARLSVKRIIRTIREWRTSTVSPVATEVTVELMLDSSLSPNVRNYRIEKGRDGLVTKMTISGPVLEELKKRVPERVRR